MARQLPSFWYLRLVAHFTVFGVVLNLGLQHVEPLALLIAGAVVFDLLLPVWPWNRRWTAPAVLAVMAVDVALIGVAMAVDGHPEATAIAVFVVAPVATRLPRPWSLAGYALVPAMGCVLWTVFSPASTPWSTVALMTTGYVSVIALSEAFYGARWTALENSRLLDQLVAAQQRVQGVLGDHEAADAVAAEPVSPLTRRDREVLALVAKGLSNREIAERLFLAEGTVKNRVSGILEKTGVRDRTQAALRARELGVL